MSKEFPLEETSIWRKAKELGISENIIEKFLTNDNGNGTSFDDCEHQNITECLTLIVKESKRLATLARQMTEVAASSTSWRMTIPMTLVLLLLLFFAHVGYNDGGDDVERLLKSVAGVEWLVTDAHVMYARLILGGTIAAHLFEFGLMCLVKKRMEGTIENFVMTTMFGFLYWSQLPKMNDSRDQMMKRKKE